ncbi:hypothetical protein Tco_1355263 [Tanacetum coccineum]
MSTWFKQPPRPETPDPEWSKDPNADVGPKQSWFNALEKATKDPAEFDDLMGSTIYFSNFGKYRLKKDKITKANLEGPVLKLLKGTCRSDRCPYDLSKPLPFQGPPGHHTIHVGFFFNNDLEYLKTRNKERKYTTSITKEKYAMYGLEGIEDMIPRLWSPVKVAYDIDATLGISHWGPKLVRRANQKEYTLKEGDFPRLHLNDIEDMLLLLVQNKLFNLHGNDIVDLVIALRMFTQSLVIKKRVEDVQLRVESYQKKLNITKPQTTFDPKGVVYLEEP